MAMVIIRFLSQTVTILVLIALTLPIVTTMVMSIKAMVRMLLLMGPMAGTGDTVVMGAMGAMGGMRAKEDTEDTEDMEDTRDTGDMGDTGDTGDMELDLMRNLGIVTRHQKSCLR